MRYQTNRLSNSHRKQRQSGQSMTEYLYVCGVVAVALGVGMQYPNDPLSLMLGAFRQVYDNYSYALSLPEIPASWAP